jgi:hypothetical protein
VEKFDRIFSNFIYIFQKACMQDYLDYLPYYSCFVTELGSNKRRLGQIFTFKIKTLPTATKIPKSTKGYIFV